MEDAERAVAERPAAGNLHDYVSVVSLSQAERRADSRMVHSERGLGCSVEICTYYCLYCSTEAPPNARVGKRDTYLALSPKWNYLAS